MDNKMTIVFQDYGQDFLEWDIERDNANDPTYVVVGCRPFQEKVWKGTKVHTANRIIGPGFFLEITTPGEWSRTRLVYPVKDVDGKREWIGNTKPASGQK